MKRPALTLGAAVAACLVGAGLFLYRSTDPAPIDTIVQPPAPAFVDHGPPLGPSSAPTEELGALPQIPDKRPRNENYIVISRRYNRLWLMRGDSVLRAAVCATGKGDTLTWQGHDKTWVFNTPHGEFSVLYKMPNPRWVPPIWEYVEQGKNPPDWLGRVHQADYTTLGDYAINFGNEYAIHGTPLEDLLGQSITHGCVRVGETDLAYIYPRVHIGTKIFIY